MFPYTKYLATLGCGKLCLREGAIQQGDEPNERRKRDFLGGFGGMLPQEFSRITLSKTAFHVFWRQYNKKTGTQKRT